MNRYALLKEVQALIKLSYIQPYFDPDDKSTITYGTFKPYLSNIVTQLVKHELIIIDKITHSSDIMVDLQFRVPNDTRIQLKFLKL